MIQKMKKIVIVAPSERKASLLDGVRDLGLVHVSEMAAPDSALSAELNDLNRVRTVLQEAQKAQKAAAKKNKGKVSADVAEDSKPVMLDGAFFNTLHKSLLSKIDERSSLSDSLTKLKVAMDNIAKWGDFDPSEVNRLKDVGFELSFYLIDAKLMQTLPEDVRYFKLKEIEKKKCTIAVLGEPLGQEFASSRFNLPEKGVSQLRHELDKATKRIAEIDADFASSVKYISSYDRQILKVTDSIMYNSVKEGASEEEGLTLIQGFIPEADMGTFKDAAKAGCWAYAVDDPSDEDPVPTKVTYNKVTRMMKPVFDMLGTVPGYREYDISTWFMMFFALFFAMIIGDAAYGMIFLAVAILLNVKLKKVNNIVLLLYVMSIATVIWGALTGTWFGAQGALKIPFLKKLVIPSISNYPELFGVSSKTAQNTVMKFCFSIGAVQLSLACLMNVVRKWKERCLAFVADFAWLAMILSIYELALMLVIGESINVSLVFGIVAVGFVLVLLFGGQEKGKSFAAGLKAGLGGAFTTFLDTISCFGNVMSYIRLFAVGMASLAISQSFNGMASPMLKGFALPAGILVLVIGHGLNLIMGLLSVVVHGVRLNLLEFSGQLGMEWAGIPYEPFKKNV